MRKAGVSAAVVGAVAIGLTMLAASEAWGQERSGRAPADLGLLLFDGAEIGVSVRDVEAGDRQAGGVVIEDVRAASPAEKAGLARSDFIVEFDGERVRSAGQFSRLVRESVPDRVLNATILRGGQRRTVPITPVRRRADFGAADRLRERFDLLADRLLHDVRPDAGSRQLGIVVQDMPRQLAEFFGAKEGVLVTAVTDDSPAARAGLKAGDVITTIDGSAVRTRADIVRALGSRVGTGPVEIALGLVRDKKETTVKVTAGPSRGTRRSRRTT